MRKITLKAEDLDGYLTTEDKTQLAELEERYRAALAFFQDFSTAEAGNERRREKDAIISAYNEISALTQRLCRENSGIKVYSFLSARENHAEASRVIAKLRDSRTEKQEFIYYIQRAYEMLFKLAYGRAAAANKNYLIVKTPVTRPAQNFAVHKIDSIDERVENAVLCVMLRGALLPSMILSKEIQEYSSRGCVTPFALFSIKRADTKREDDMEYILDLDRSYFDTRLLDGKDLVFADPMNATAGSLVTVVNYLRSYGVTPKSITVINVIAALKGALRAVRALPNCTVYTLWMDPVLNESAYIMPGLGDAGDRINGEDDAEHPRGAFALIAEYGSTIARLYRAQLREIENTVLGARR